MTSSATPGYFQWDCHEKTQNMKPYCESVGVDSLDGNIEQTELLRATLSDDKTWRDADGISLPVSASDLERHEYCPLSWSLSRQGNSGQGEAIVAGIKRHAKIHEKMKDFQEIQAQKRRSVTFGHGGFRSLLH